MSKVYVVQNQHRWDSQKQELVPKFDLKKAEQYGDIEFLLSPKAKPFQPAAVIAELREGLRYYRSEDYLLLIGNPCLIGWAVALAAERADGRVNLLQWNGSEQRYLPIRSTLKQPSLPAVATN